MKEITTVLNVQITYVQKYEDKQAKIIEEVTPQAAEKWAEALKDITEANDLQLLDYKLSIVDTED